MQLYFLDADVLANKEEISEFLEDLRELGIGDQSPVSVKKEEPVLETSITGIEESPAIQKLSSQWVPLELCFGIPLFDDETNRSISQKVQYIQ